MPEFEVIVRRTLEETLSVTVTAKDEDAAQEKVEQRISELGTAAAIAKAYKEDWEYESENIEVEEVIER